MADTDTTPPTDLVRRAFAAVKRGNQPRGSGTIAPPDEPPRRLMAAGHVILVGLICLSVGWLLNAQGIKKTAHGQPLGWRRDIAILLADPIASISSFLRLDRPREALQSSLGREGDDDINTELPSPTTLPAGATTSTVQTAFSPDAPMRVWVGGDSLSVRPGEAMIRNFSSASEDVVEMISPDVDEQIGTGLARPEVFNWPEHLQNVAAEQDPDVMVLGIGSNDDQGLTEAPDVGNIPDFGSEAWQAEYRRRVGGLMDQVVGEGRVLFWIGNPIVRDGGRSLEYELINEIVRTEAEKREGRVFFVDIYDMFKDPNGNFAEYLPNASGELVRYREPDGIHVTPAGGDRIFEEIFRITAENFDLTSWRNEPTTTTAPPPATTAATTPVETAPPP